MIQIYGGLYWTKSNGITLRPSEASVKVEINGPWSAKLVHPIDSEGIWKNIEIDSVVRMPSWNGKQFFRIKKTEKTEQEITCEMEPIFYDSIDDCFLHDVRPTKKTGDQALAIMLSGNDKYTYFTDIEKVATAYYENVNFMEALNGDQDNAFVKRWGGEILFDNFCVWVLQELGSDRNVWITYGKNIERNGIKETIDTSNIVTRIYPKAFNGRKPEDIGVEPYFDSDNIYTYDTIHAKEIKFEHVKLRADVQDGDIDEDDIICETWHDLVNELYDQCMAQFAAGLDKPEVKLEVNLVQMEYTDLFGRKGSYEEMSLGDTVHIKHARLGIKSDARIIGMEYDSIRQKVTKMTIGNYKPNGKNWWDLISG